MSYHDLAVAIAEQAFVDYRTLSAYCRKYPDSHTLKRRKNKLREIILSDRFRQLTDIDVDYMLKKIDEFIEGEGKHCISVGLS